MSRTTLLIAVFVCFLALRSGCAINDPNRNDKMRYQMAHSHARRVLTETGSDLTPYSPDYELMIFWRRHYDESTKTVHDCQLYDFVKASPEPGPERFVIAYDKATRKTYLRADLRSNENLEALRSVEPPATVD